MMSFSGKKLFTLLLLIAAITGGVFWQVGGQAPKGKEHEIRHKEFQVKHGDFRMEVNASGLVKPINRIEIKSKASGRIVLLPVEEGSIVRQGDLIARLDQQDELSNAALAEADLSIAKAEQKQAELMFGRRNTLYQKKIISEEEREQTALQLAVAKGKVIQAATALDRAKERLNDSVVLAPIEGIILQKYVEKGQIISSGVSNVSGGTTIVDIATMHTVYIEAGIDEIDIGKVEVGQSAAVIAEAYPELTFQGRVIRIAPEAKVEQNVTLFDVIIEVANTDNKLKSGMNTRIQITTLEKKNVLLAPVIAFKPSGIESSGVPSLREDKNTQMVLLKEGGQFVPHSVTLGLSDFKQAEIVSGLKEGDVLGVEMTSRLKEENDQMEKRIRDSRSFGSGAKKEKK